MSTDTTNQGVDELIRQDHRRVETLIASIASDPERIRGELVKLLSTHSVAEEMVVYPMLLEDGDQGKSANHRAREEHDRIKVALAAVDKADPNDPTFLELVRELEAAVSAHVMEEESTLLPMLRSMVGEEQMRSIAGRFETAKAAAPTRPHPNAPDSATGHLIVGAPTSIVDRARDAIDPDRP